MRNTFTSGIRYSELLAAGSAPAGKAGAARQDAGHDDDDLRRFARALEQQYGVPEPGDYAIELIGSRGMRQVTSAGSGAVLLWFTVRFLEGLRRDRELQLSLVVDGPKAMTPLIIHGLRVLEDWRRGTGTPAATSYISLVRDIARNGRRLRTVAKLGHRRAADGSVAPTLIGIRIEGVRR